MVTRELRDAGVGGRGNAVASDATGRVRYCGSAHDVGRWRLVRIEQAPGAWGIGRGLIRTRQNSRSAMACIRRVEARENGQVDWRERLLEASPSESLGHRHLFGWAW